MTKKVQQERPSLDEVKELLAAPKRIVQFIWIPEASKRNPAYVKTHCAISDESGVTLPDVVVRCQWRPPVVAPSAHKYSFGLYLRDEFRISAVDVEPFGRHQNKPTTGKGMPYYNQRMPGTHQHIWVSDGEGHDYVEPLDELAPPDNMLSFWQFFCSITNITNSDVFAHPDTSKASGQGKLLL